MRKLLDEIAATTAKLAELETDKPELRMILYRKRGQYRLAACRGLSKGCNVDLKVRSKMGPCEHCVLADNPNETVGELVERINRGDA